ncbi:MAG: succinyl-diaminopimelate desuccinylase [Desulforhopalus sp.]
MKTPEKQQDLLSLTKELIKIPSTHSRPDKIHECDRWIQTWLHSQDIHFTAVEHNNVPSLLVLPKKDYSPILLMSHFDVVEADTGDLFSPREQNGKLYGRGAIDDKYGVALSLTLFKQHLDRLAKHGLGQEDMPFGLLLTGDEEIGGANGTAKAIEQFSTDFFITIDGGNPDLIVTKEKGILLLELTANGKSAHAARPWLGENAFDILVSDYLRIQELFKIQTKDHWNKTASLTQCTAGNGSTNMVLGSARALLDIRYTEQDDPDEIFRTISDVTSSDVQIKAIEPVFSSGKSPYLDHLIASSNGTKVGREHGASDARFLASRGIPGVIWGADGEMSQHTEDEHLVISSLFDIYERLDRFITTLPN